MKSNAERFSPAFGRQVLLVTILASSMAFIDGTALNVVLPILQTDLQARGADLLWIVNAYLLMLASLILIGGSLGDIFGRKKIFASGMLIFLFASLICGIAPNINVLIAARVLQGIGGALMIPGSLAILSANFPANLRGRAIGTWSAATTLVMIVGPVLGGLLGDLGLWRLVFLINIPIGIFSLVLLLTKIPESQNNSLPRVVDYPGAILVALGLAGLTWGLLSAPETGISDPAVLISIIGGFLALVVFFLVQSRRKFPMMPLNLFKSRAFSGANLLTLFLYGALNVAMVFFSLNLVQAQNYSPSLAGMAMLPFMLFLTLLSRWSGGLSDRIGPRLPLIVGPAIVGIGFFLLALPGQTSGADQYWTTFFPGIAAFGIGMGITVAPLTTTVMSSLPVQYSGTASGINNAVSRIAGVLAVAVLGAAAIASFQTGLVERSAHIPLTSQQAVELATGASRLGDTPLPSGLDPIQSAAVKNAIQLAFISSYRTILIACAALAWLSALMAAFFIPGRLHNEQVRQESAQFHPGD